METTTSTPPKLIDFPQANRAYSVLKYAGAFIVGVVTIGTLVDSYRTGNVYLYNIPGVLSGAMIYAVGHLSRARIEKRLSELTEAPKIVKETSWWYGPAFAARVLSPAPRQMVYGIIAQHFLEHKLSISGDAQHISGVKVGGRIDTMIQESPSGTVVDLLRVGWGTKDSLAEGLVSKLIV